MAADLPGAASSALAAIAAMDVGLALRDEPLARHTTWRIGGPADLLVEPENDRQTALLVQAVAAAGLPLVVIGRGSNLLFSDLGLRGVVLKIGDRMSGFRARGALISAGAGTFLPLLARRAGALGISGFEHAVGIPGTVGGLVLMNGGSQRKCIGDNVSLIRGITRAGEAVCVEGAQCEFSYRHCKLPYDGLVVTGVELRGWAGDPAAIRREMLLLLRERRGKFPMKEPSCGSVFLSAPKLHGMVGAPGKVIEEAGLKGLSIGGAQVSPKHANFIVNRGGASAREVLALIGAIRRHVLASYGVELCCEVRYVDPLGEVHAAHEVGEATGDEAQA